MRIAVMGSGAVGAYFGAKLARAGNDVAFVARGNHLTAMRCHGLHVHSPEGNLHVQNSLFTETPSDIGIVDLILFCVKSYDTQTAVKALGPLIGPDTTILSLQNGIDNPAKIAEQWGAERTWAGVVYIGAHISSPGIVNHSSGGRIISGPLKSKPAEKIYAIESILSAAGVPCQIVSNIQQIQWTKLLWNAPFCAIACITGANVAEILRSQELTAIAVECMKEVRAAARTRDIDIDSQLISDTLKFSKSLGSFKPSMLQDLEAGKPLEYEAFNGIVVRLLKEHGLEAPVNRVFYATLAYRESQDRAGRYTAQHARTHNSSNPP
jgi:2-dehydropantoate 2-reductase